MSDNIDEVVNPPRGYCIGVFGTRNDGMIGPFATEDEARQALAQACICVVGEAGDRLRAENERLRRLHQGQAEHIAARQTENESLRAKLGRVRELAEAALPYTPSRPARARLHHILQALDTPLACVGNQQTTYTEGDR